MLVRAGRARGQVHPHAERKRVGVLTEHFGVDVGVELDTEGDRIFAPRPTLETEVAGREAGPGSGSADGQLSVTSGTESSGWQTRHGLRPRPDASAGVR